MNHVYVTHLEQKHEGLIRGYRVDPYCERLEDAMEAAIRDRHLRRESPQFMASARYVIRRHDVGFGIRDDRREIRQWVIEAEAASPLAPWGEMSLPTDPPKVDLTPGFSKVD